MSGYAAVLLLLSSVAALSQSQTTPPAFEVADAKVNKSGEARMAVDFLPGGKLSLHNAPRSVLPPEYHPTL
jgi:hypothetical protein